MSHSEKKYRVESLESFRKKLADLKIPVQKHVVSTHYYGQHEGNDIEKFVEYPDRCEIHIFKEVNGTFTSTLSEKIADTHAGFDWLKSRGFTKANIVKMDYTDYSYKNGIVGLYIIDDFLYSVILDYPEGEYSEMEKEFGLELAEVIRVPYNKYLDQLSCLRTINL